jgi:sugar phosphate isomerase/epimerase
MSQYKYAVNTNSLKDMTPSEIAKLAARLGYDGIEWGLPKDGLCVELLKEMAHVTKEEGLEVCGYINAGQLWKADVMRTYTDLVAAVDGKTLRVAHPWLGYNFDESLHQRDSFMTLFARAREGLEALVPLSEESGIQYVLEMHGGSMTASASACRHLMGGLPASAVGVIFDPANTVLEGFLRPRHSAEVLGPYLSYVHAKNVVITYSGDVLPGAVKRPAFTSKVCPINSGMLDWVETFFALNCVGYEGWIAVEEFFKENTEAQLTRGLAELKECAAAAPCGPQEPFTTFND